jgi:two-component system, NtrC family, sensor kinase
MRLKIIYIILLSLIILPIQSLSENLEPSFILTSQIINYSLSNITFLNYYLIQFLVAHTFWINLGLYAIAGLTIIFIILLYNYKRTHNITRLGKLVDQKTKELFNKNYEIEQINNALGAEKEYLKVTLEAIGDGVIAVDSEGEILFVNKAAENLFAITEFEVIGVKIENVIKQMIENTDDDSIGVCIVSPLDEFVIVKGKQIIINTNDGKRKIILVGSSIIHQDNQRGVVFTFRDKTALVSIENQLSLSQKMESVGQLAAGIAHEINTPLQYVGDNTEFLENAFFALNMYVKSVREILATEISHHEICELIQKKENELDIDYYFQEIPEALEQSGIGIKQVNRIVLSMKDFAHPGTKEKAAYDINHGIEVTKNISRNKWKYVANLETFLSPDLPQVYCSLDEINQVILNLILNGSDAIEENINKSIFDKGLIKIETQKVNDSVEIKITDNGSGIPTYNHQKIFDPFFTTKEVGKGTGQGLSICYDIIVKKHNGNIFLDSTPGIGSTFTIKLPISNSLSNQK